MKRAFLPLVLILLVLAAAGGGVWLLTHRGESAEAASAAPGRTEQRAVAPAAEDSAGGLRPDGPAAEQGARRTTEAVAVEEVWDAEESQWVLGSVERAECGDGEDRSLVAYAAERAFTLTELAARLADEGAGEELQEGQGLILSRRPVEADGSFELPFPPDESDAHVLVVGAREYAERSSRVELSGGSGGLLMKLRCGARVVGRVVASEPGAAGEPELGDIEVTLREDDSSVRHGREPVRRSTRTAPDGSFRFDALPAGRAVALAVGPEDWAPVRLELGALDEGETREVQARLVRGGTIAGRVVDQDGRPVAEAHVRSEVSGGILSAAWGARRVDSGADGSFELVALPGGRIKLEADAPGFLESKADFAVLAEGETLRGVELVLDRGASLSGTVAWPDGEPAEGVEVHVRFDLAQRFGGMGAFAAARGARGDATSDAQGRWEVTGLGRGPFMLFAEAEAPAERADALLALVSPEVAARAGSGEGEVFDAPWTTNQMNLRPDTTDIALVLEAPRGVGGVVLDENDEPVTEFRIRALRQVETIVGDIGIDRHEEGYEDEAGRFFLSGLSSGRWRFYALADGFGLPEPTLVTLGADGEGDGQVLELHIERAATVSGTVRTPDGAPLGDAVVTVDTGEAIWKSMIGEQPRLPETTSGPDGEFRLEGLRPGDVRVVARSEQFAKATPVELSLEPGAVAEDVELVLGMGGRLVGRIYDANGEPIANAPVQVLFTDTWDTRLDNADGQGRFVFDHLEPGSWQVIALPSQERIEGVSDDSEVQGLWTEMKQALVNIAEGEETEVVLGAPPEDPIQVHGRVLLDGQGVPDVVVMFYGEGTGLMEGMRRASTKADGTFELTLDGAGEYLAQVQRLYGGANQQSVTEFRTEIPETEEHDLLLELPGGRISGRVLGADGKPAKNERVSLVHDGPVLNGFFYGGNYAEVRTGPDGRYELNGLRKGRYVLGVGGMEAGGLFDTAARNARELRRIELDEDEWRSDEDFRLETPATLLVRVVDAVGRPVEKAAIFVRDGEGRLLEILAMTATNAEGQRVYGGLAPGRYTVSARAGQLATHESAPVRVAAGEQAQATLTVEEGTVLWIRNAGPDGEPVPMRLTVTDEDGREVQGMIALAEVFALAGAREFDLDEQRVGPLPPGRYRVVGVDEDGNEVSKPVNLSGQPERRLTLRFRD